MTLNELQKECLRLEPKYLTRGQEALMGFMGLNGAAGECLDLYKKTLFEGAVLDEKATTDALAQCVCYISIAANSMDVDLESVLKRCKEIVRDADAGDKKD